MILDRVRYDFIVKPWNRRPWRVQNDNAGARILPFVSRLHRLFRIGLSS